MIEKFRRKFIIYASTSIFALILLILGTINLVNFGVLASNADEVTSLLASNGGVFQEREPRPEPATNGNETPVASDNGQEGDSAPLDPSQQDPGQLGPGRHGPMDPINPETEMSTRYFTIRLDENGNATMVKFAMSENTVGADEALTWGASLASNQKGWTRTTFRYRTYQYNQQTYVSVIDYSRELSPSYRVLWSSLIGGFAGLLVIVLALIPVSKILVKPLETSIKKQQRFVADASHELKTPLTIISANKDIIEAEYGESESTQAIAKQVTRLTGMVKNLNALARMEEEEKHLTSTFNLGALASDILMPYESAFMAKNVQFSAEIPEQIPFKGDEKMMGKLLGILMENALKYSLTTAEFHLYRNGERTVIKVINDAEGIEEGTLDRVFERFYRSESARASLVEGSGIGLSIAKEIVSAHSGRIIAKGENGKFIIKAEF